jgi:transposase-like protein
MQRRPWDAKTKARIVLQGLQGKPVAELCTEHQISQSLYDQWVIVQGVAREGDGGQQTLDVF